MGDDKSSEPAEGNAADVEFLTGMKPHHAQAVEMSDIVLASNPPAAVAEAEIAETQALLKDL